MISARIAIQSREVVTQQNFRMFPDGHGHWYAYKDDGLVAGLFFNRAAAARFVRDESDFCTAPARSATAEEGAAARLAATPKPFKSRRFALLAQLAFLGFLLIGRVAANVMDGAVAPSFAAPISSDSSGAGSANE